MNTKLLGVVLCGGKSSRMGRDKTTLPHPHGGTFLQQALDRLSGPCDATIISGLPPTPTQAPIPTVEDPIPHRGPATGIATALGYAREHGFAACLITPVDTPWLESDDLQRLVQQWQTCGGLITANSDRLEPLIGIYPVELTEELAKLATSADRSLFRWIQRHPCSTVPISVRSCRNINTLEDLIDG